MEIKRCVQLSSIIIIVGNTPGLETVWFIGDTFLATTFQEYFMRLEDGYIRDNYEVKSFASNAYFSNDNNGLSRLRNNLIFATKKMGTLPKLIVVVIEDDVIKFLDKYGKINRKAGEKILGESDAYGRAAHWLLNEYKKVITSFKDLLNNKNKRPKWPHVLWLLPSTNVGYFNNDQRRKFGDALASLVRLYDDMSALGFGQSWTYSDNNVFLRAYNRFTTSGLSSFWRATDRTTRYCLAKAFNNVPDKHNLQKEAFQPTEICQVRWEQKRKFNNH